MALLASLFIFEQINANDSILGIPLPENIEETVEQVLRPVLDFMEPYKVVDTAHERGVPEIHDEYSKLLAQFAIFD